MAGERPRVVLITQTFPPEKGGNASRVGDTIEHLVDEGWDVSVVAPLSCYPPGNFDRSWERVNSYPYHGATVYRLWTWQPQSPDPDFVQRVAYFLAFAVHASIWLLLNERDADVYLSTTPPIFTALPAFFLSKVRRTPWVIDVGDLWIDVAESLGFVPEDSVITRASRRFQRRLLLDADRILTTTAEMSDVIVDRYADVSAGKVRRIPNGVDTDRFEPSRSASSSERVVVYTGNLGHAQDLESCIRAMQYVETDLTLEIYGDGDRRPDLQRLVDELGLDDSVTFHGFVQRDHIPRVLQQATIGIAPLESIPALRYAVPTKTYEYMLSGLPVVGTGTGAIERLISDAECGVVADNDPESIAAAFDGLSRSRDLRERFSERGRRYARRYCDKRTIAKKLSRELRSVIASQPAPAGDSRRAIAVEGGDDA